MVRYWINLSVVGLLAGPLVLTGGAYLMTELSNYEAGNSPLVLLCTVTVCASESH